MQDIPYFSLVSSLLRQKGIVINGKFYHVDSSGKDGSLLINSENYPLKYQGQLDEIQSVDELVNQFEINRFIEQASLSIRYKCLAGFSDNSVIIAQLMGEVLPLLYDFDSRIHDIPKDELIALRKKDILDMIHTEDYILGDNEKEKIMRGIQTGFKVLLDQTYSKDTGKLEDFNYPNLNLLFLGPDEAYNLKSRKYHGEITLKIGNKGMLFAKGELVDISDLITSLNYSRMRFFLEETAKEEDSKILAENSRYLKLATALNFQRHLHYESSGIRLINPKGGDKVFLYLRPPGFAMHDIREEYLERWYPFPNPPEIGVTVSWGEKTLETSEVVAHGDFKFITFSSENGKLTRFCGAKSFSKDMLSWQEDIAEKIRYGVYTLMNGMSAKSLSEHSSEGVLGQRYRIPLSSLNWIPESEVERLGLMKTNIHEIVPARQ